MRTVVYVQPTSEIGGSDIALLRLVAHLDRERFRPVVVLPRRGPLLSRLEEAGATVRILPMVQLSTRRSLRHQARFLVLFWPTVVRLARLLRRERADVVHSNSLNALYGAWAARLARRPHVWHIRELPELPRPLLRAATTMVRRLSSRVIAMTAAVSSRFAPAQRDEELVCRLADGIELRTFHPGVGGTRIREALGIGAGAPLVGFVGRLDPWKGADVFVRAAAKVAAERPDAHFVVCGGELPGYEAHASEVRRLAADLGLNGNMHFTEWRFCLDDIPEVMAALTVLVHTSVSPEPFGLVLVEAMATARPVVAARDGGVPEVVEDGVTGLLIRPGDAGAYARAITGLLADPTAAHAMGKAGRRRAEQLFDVRSYVHSVEAIYDDVLSTQGVAR
jgi:glycosyltransferase involved in cell wall biosynthesis